MDRWNNEAKITEILGLFGLPFKYNDGTPVPFCAAGIGYSAAIAFAKASKLGTDKDTLQKMLPAVDYFDFYPSPGVLNMSQVARGKSRWIDRTDKSIPEQGWLVVYDWSGSNDPERTSHVGIILSADSRKLETLEFNTGNTAHPRGGTVAYKTRDYNDMVKGFIKTNPLHIRPKA
jgi:hypothetical protein